MRHNAAGVIVGADDGGGGFADGFAKDFARMGERGAGGAGGDLDAAEEPVFAVEAEHPEFLDGESVGDGEEVLGDDVGAIEERTLGRILGDDTAGDFHDGDELEGLDAADALEPAEVLGRPADEAGKRAPLGDQAGGEREDILAAGAAAEEHGEEFGVGERPGTEAFEALLSPRGPMILIKRGEAPSAAGPAAAEDQIDPRQRELERRS